MLTGRRVVAAVTFAIKFKSLLDRSNSTKHRLAIDTTLDVRSRTKLIGQHPRYP